MVIEFSVEQRKQIVFARKKSQNAPEAQKLLKKVGITVPVSTIKRLWCRSKLGQSLANMGGRGRKRKTVKREDEALVKRVKRNRLKSFVQHAKEMTARIGISVSRSLVSRRLKERNFARRVGVHRPPLNENHKARRLAFANAHIHRSMTFWKSIKYSDEKIFSTSNDGLHVLVTRRPDEKYRPDCIVPTARWGLQVHVWGIISWWGVGPLRILQGSLTATKYVDNIIYDIRELCNEERNGRRIRFKFMQDNARPHSAQHTQQFLATSGVEVLDWPANSPDLNPIENLWADVARRVRARGVPRRAAELRQWVNEEWASTPVETVRRLYRSIPDRLRKVIDTGGGQEHY